LSSSLTLTRPHEAQSQVQAPAQSHIEAPSRGIIRSVFDPVAAAFGKIRRFGKRVGEAQARGLMTGFYYVVLGPFSFIGASRRRQHDADSKTAPTWHPVTYRRAADHHHQQY
jgi:hypothetical protein